MKKIKYSYISQELYKSIIDYIYGYKNLLLAFSGGLDSTVLLDILTILRDEQQKKITLRAIHVNHGLSKYADDWVYHCEQQCKQRNIHFKVFSVKINDIGDSIEASARKLRYQILRNNLLKKEVLLTGHHQDDQAETLLLALKRGSGPAGLASMAIDTEFYGHRLLRPLLKCSKEKLILYAKEKKISWIEDDSNNNDRFDRNFIRKYIVQIKKRWPTFCNTVARSAKLCADQEKLIDELLKEKITLLIHPNDYSLDFTPLLTMSSIMRRAILRRWLAANGIKMPSCKQLSNIWYEVALSRRDAVPQLKIAKQLLLRRFRNRLYILQVQDFQQLYNINILWPSNKEYIFLPKNLGLLTRQSVNFKENIQCKIELCKFSVIRAPRDDENIYVRFGNVNGLIHIIGRDRSRKLKKIWQELAVPPWLRKCIPLLYYNNILITALGFFVTIENEVTNCSKLRINWVKNKSIKKLFLAINNSC